MIRKNLFLQNTGLWMAHCAAVLSPVIVATPTASFSTHDFHNPTTLTPTTLVAATANVIKQFEGSKPGGKPGNLAIYTDLAGHYSACYGRLLSPSKAKELKHQHPNGIPNIICEQWLREDTITAMQTVLKQGNPQVPMMPGQLVALTSLAYNVGSFGNGLSSHLKKGDYTKASEVTLLLYNKGFINGIKQPIPGLTNRRQAEVRIAKYGLPGLPNAPIKPAKILNALNPNASPPPNDTVIANGQTGNNNTVPSLFEAFTSFIVKEL